MDDGAVLDVGAGADADDLMSPRTRQWNQIPVSEPITTSPITAAVGAMKASGAIVGVTPSSEKIGPEAASIGIGSGIRHFPRADAGVQAKHQPDVLHRGAGRALAEIVQARDQHRLTVFLVGVDSRVPAGRCRSAPPAPACRRPGRGSTRTRSQPA